MYQFYHILCPINYSQPTHVDAHLCLIQPFSLFPKELDAI